MFDKDQSTLQLVFDNLISTDFHISSLLIEQDIDNIISSLEKFKYYELQVLPIETKNFYILYLFANLLTEHLKDIYDIIDDKIYLNNIIITSKFQDCKKILASNIRSTYKEVKQICKEVHDFYIIFYNSDSSLIQSEILNIFLLQIFREHDPLNVVDLREYYKSLLRFLYYSYLKDKTDSKVEEDLSPVISREERYILESSRSKIYNNGIKKTEIQKLCNESPVLKRINDNTYKIKNNILQNELQNIYLMSNRNDPRLSILLINFNPTIKSEDLRLKCGVIYRLLRALHIDDGYQIKNEYYESARKSIYASFYVHFNGIVNEEILIPAITSISDKLTKSLCIGSYLDILTLEKIDIEHPNFPIQLRTFFSLLLKDIDLHIRDL